LFTQFYGSRPARRRSGGGRGWGLRIVGAANRSIGSASARTAAPGSLAEWRQVGGPGAVPGRGRGGLPGRARSAAAVGRWRRGRRPDAVGKADSREGTRVPTSPSPVQSTSSSHACRVARSLSDTPVIPLGISSRRCLVPLLPGPSRVSSGVGLCFSLASCVRL
jgi:hypothetical protein